MCDIDKFFGVFVLGVGTGVGGMQVGHSAGKKAMTDVGGYTGK